MKILLLAIFGVIVTAGQAKAIALQNGRIERRVDSNWVRFENGTKLRNGTKIRQSCISRYELYMDGYLNKYYTKSTFNNGSWEPRIASCKEKRCQVPSKKNGTPKLSDGSTATGKVEHGIVVTTMCDAKFELDPTSTASSRCSYGQLKLPECIAKKCNTTSIPGVETLEIINNSVKLSIGVAVESMENVSVFCRPGFDPDIDYEDLYVMSCDHGDWSKELICTPKRCDTIAIPDVETLDIFNNDVKLSAGITIESMKNVSVKCRPGFDPDIDYEDPYFMSCDHGVWSKELTCTSEKCNTTSIPGVETMFLFFNDVKLSGEMTVVSMENVSVECKPGFDPYIDNEDPYVMSCDHGNWSKELTCTPKKCNTSSIPGVETLDIFNSSVKLLGGKTIESMDNISVKCRSGLDPDIDYEDPYVMSCNHGVWSKELTCTPKKCNTTIIPGVETLDIFNRSIKLSVGTTIGSMENVSIKCRLGFDPDVDYEDPYVMSCNHGVWSKELTCTPKKCNTTIIPGVETLGIFNRSIKLSVGTTIESMENVSIKCRLGFDPDVDYEDPYVMSCDHGVWSKELTCTPKKCNTTSISGVETLDLFHNDIKLSVEMTVESMENVSVKCRPGFDPDIDYEDPYVMLCDHGYWSKELACTSKKCNTTRIPGVETLDIFYSGVKLLDGKTIESMDNISVKCRLGFDPDVEYEYPYVMSCDHGVWSKELTCTPTVEKSVPVRVGLVAGCVGGVALLILIVGVIVARRWYRSRQRMGIKPTDSIDNRETELRANDFAKINKTFPRYNRHEDLQTTLRANDYGKIDRTLPRTNRREGLQTKHHRHSYENVYIDKHPANAGEGLTLDTFLSPD